MEGLAKNSRDRIKMAIIGAGTWGATHAKIYNAHPCAQVTGICDLNTARAAEIAHSIGLSEKSVYGDYKKMLEEADIDAVAIVTPDFLHRQIAVDCADAGKHMIIEKPLATTGEDMEAITGALEKNRVRAMVDFHNRWNPPFAQVKQSVEGGEIGTPYSAYIRLNDIKWVPRHMLSWAASSSILWFLGSHSVDTLRWLFDDEVEEVYSVCREGILKGEGIDTADIYQTILRFKKGGIATMENGWITPDTHPCVNDFKFNLTGTTGMFNLDLSNSQMIERFTNESSDRPDILVKHFIHGVPKGFSYESIRHFVDCLASGEDFHVTLDDAVNNSLAILAVMESARTNKPVRVKKWGAHD